MAPTYEGIMVSPPIVELPTGILHSQDTGLFYVTSFDGEQEFFKRDEDYEEGERFTGGGGRYTSPMDAFHSSIRAINPETAEIEWEFPIMPRSSAGITTTAEVWFLPVVLTVIFSRWMQVPARNCGTSLSAAESMPHQ